MRLAAFAFALALHLAWSGAARASCGSAFCAIETGWDMRGAWSGEGTRLDLRYEQLRQDQPRAGSSKVGFGQLRRHHDEVSTRNRNWVATLEQGLARDWSISASLPLLERDHRHIHNHRGAQLPEAWTYSAAGDLRLQVRHQPFQFESRDTPALGRAGWSGGAKLPTGRRDQRNGDGVLAERSLQPGSGTTDLLLGAFTTWGLPAWDLSVFAQGTLQLPVGERSGFRPGRRFALDAGLRHDVDERWSLMLQLNALWRSRDRGLEAEPADTGGSALFISPGASYALGRDVRLYGFLQAPLYQYANGVQITPRRAWILGVNWRF